MNTTPLGEILAREITADGPISVARYMAIALGHPEHGYYTTRDPLGRGGDFITAPEISQIFGELIGLWMAHAWTRIGSPERVALVELGPGRGTLMADALRGIGRAAPAFGAALEVHLVETSPALRERQATSLHGLRPEWHRAVASLPDLPLLAIANEFLDTLPVRQFQRRGQAWHERVIGLSEGRFAFGLDPAPVSARDLPDAQEGAIFERSDAAVAVITDLSAQIARRRGALLAIDYGHVTTGFGDTLQAVAGHAFVDPLARPGDADLTAHVDFAALAAAAAAQGAAIDLLTTQAEFLAALGIDARAAALKGRATPAQARDVDLAVARLTDRSPRGMGELFKVLAICSGAV